MLQPDNSHHPTGYPFRRKEKKLSACSIRTSYTAHTTNTIASALSIPQPSEIRPSHPMAAVVRVLSRKVLNKKRYAMQVMKHSLMEGDSSLESSLQSVGRYDPLLFNDEQLHSVQKILETQYINTKVWAFISLKTHMKTAQVEQIAESVTRYTVRAQKTVKKECFEMLRYGAQVYQQRATKGTMGLVHGGQVVVHPSAKPKPAPVLGSHNTVNISVETNVKPQNNLTVERIVLKQDSYAKQDSSISRRTHLETEYESREEAGGSWRHEGWCGTCCCHCCCCPEYNLWDRIQYMKHLERMTARLPN